MKHVSTIGLAAIALAGCASGGSQQAAVMPPPPAAMPVITQPQQPEE